MAVEFSVTRSSLAKYLKQHQKQVRFSIAQSINDLAFGTRDKWHQEAAKRFENPVPLTKKFAMVYTKADKKTLRAVLGAKDFMPKGTAPNKYLGPQVFGGQRDDKRAERALKLNGLMNATDIAIPTGAVKGRMTGARWVKVLSDLRAFTMAGANMNRSGAKAAKYFVLKDQRGKLPAGVYERMASGKPRRIIAFVRGPANYKPKFPMYEIAHHYARKNMHTMFSRRFLANIGVTRRNYLKQFSAERRMMQAQANYFRPGAYLQIR